MGEAFIIVNVDKQQFISASRMLESPKRTGFLVGQHSRALALLVCKSDELHHQYGALAGSWFEDRVIAVGDTHGRADDYGVITSTPQQPGRTLYEVARSEYEDISLAALAMICNVDEEFCARLAERAKGKHGLHARLLVGDMVYLVGCPPLEKMMVALHGKGWVAQYKSEAERRDNLFMEID